MGMGDLLTKMLTVTEAKKRKVDIATQAKKQKLLVQTENNITGLSIKNSHEASRLLQQQVSPCLASTRPKYLRTESLKQNQK